MAEKAKRFHQKCRAACWLIVITQLTILFLRWPSLPDLIPAHYDARPVRFIAGEAKLSCFYCLVFQF